MPRLPAALRRTVVTSLHHAVNALDTMLLEPLGLTSHQVVIVPTGVLAQLPWGQLPTLRAVAGGRRAVGDCVARSRYSGS